MDTAEFQAAIAASPFFRDLDVESRDALVTAGVARSIAPGGDVYERGKVSDGTFCLVLSGGFDVLGDGDVCVNTKVPGQVMGEIAILKRLGKRSATVRATAESKVLEWRYHTLEPRHPALCRYLKEVAWEHARNYL